MGVHDRRAHPAWPDVRQRRRLATAPQPQPVAAVRRGVAPRGPPGGRSPDPRAFRSQSLGDSAVRPSGVRDCAAQRTRGGRRPGGGGAPRDPRNHHFYPRLARQLALRLAAPDRLTHDLQLGRELMSTTESPRTETQSATAEKGQNATAVLPATEYESCEQCTAPVEASQ